jgi:GTP cyclohydrolase IA
MSLQTNKTDSDLGRKVQAHLEGLGIHTPIQLHTPIRGVSDYNARKHAIATKFAEIMEILNLDLKDDSLVETPQRIAKMFLGETFWGLDPANFPKVTVVENKMKYDEMIVERNIQVNSTCEHHFLPIMGFAHVAYIPEAKVPGLSKINRIVEYFSRRPQIQERLTEQIYHTLQLILGTDNIAVCIDAEHLCVKTRGVEDACSDTVTSKLGGVFKNPSVRAEFYSIVAMKKQLI